MSGNGNDQDDKLRKLQELQALMEQVAEHQQYNQIQWYKPTPKQFEFHKAGKPRDGYWGWRQRMLMAGNQLGKTLSAGMEVAMHLTGEYPDWWPGYRFTRPNHWWAAGVTGESTRDNPQRILLGRGRKWGTGTIPAATLAAKPLLARGIPDAVDSIQVVHKSGGISTLKFKSYDQGREKWQGETLDGIWWDEEPPEDIYDEGLTRLNRNKGLGLITFTPLMGMTEVVKRFLEPDPDDSGRAQRTLVHMTLDDATFYSEEDRANIENQYSPALRRARVQGLPLFGEGLIYPFNEDQIAVEPFPIPDHYRRICGLDQGMEHATALTWIAYDPDNDVVYVYDVWKQSNTSIDDRVGAWRDRGSWIPVAWPHDVGNRDAGVTGRPFADLYREKGMLMLARSARIDPETGGRQPREPIIARVYERMAKGRFKVFRNLRQWFSEQQRYHRKDGQVVDRDDDLMSATHYAVMELRHARPRYRAEHELPPRAVGVDYDPLNPIS